MSWGVGQRHGLDLALLWLWCRQAATAPIRPLPWERPYAMGVALEKTKKDKKKKKKGGMESSLLGLLVNKHEDSCSIPGLTQ